jgi:hypothetical protein
LHRYCLRTSGYFYFNSKRKDDNELQIFLNFFCDHLNPRPARVMSG